MEYSRLLEDVITEAKGFARQLGVPKDEVEDAAQEAVVEILSALPRFASRVTRYAVIDYVRANHQRWDKELSTDWQDAEERLGSEDLEPELVRYFPTSTIEDFDEPDEYPSAWFTNPKLSDMQRHTLETLYMDGWDRKRAADHLGINEETLRVRLHRIKKVLNDG